MNLGESIIVDVWQSFGQRKKRDEIYGEWVMMRGQKLEAEEE